VVTNVSKKCIASIFSVNKYSRKDKEKCPEEEQDKARKKVLRTY
jgi:hypothetical protein